MQLEQLTGLITKPSNSRRETAVADALRSGLVLKLLKTQKLSLLFGEKAAEIEAKVGRSNT